MSGFDGLIQILLVLHASRFCFRASWLVREIMIVMIVQHHA